MWNPTAPSLFRFDYVIARAVADEILLLIAEGGGTFLSADVDDVTRQMGEHDIEGLTGNLLR